jgi:hypothetical protein
MKLTEENRSTQKKPAPVPAQTEPGIEPGSPRWEADD